MKLTKLLVSTAFALVLALPFSAFAAKGDKKNDKKHETPSATFASLDKDANGSLSESEYLEAMKDKLGEDGAKKHFAELDTNKDGKLSAQEFGAAPAEPKKYGKKKKTAS